MYYCTLVVAYGDENRIHIYIYVYSTQTLWVGGNHYYAYHLFELKAVIVSTHFQYSFVRACEIRARKTDDGPKKFHLFVQSNASHTAFLCVVHRLIGIYIYMCVCSRRWDVVAYRIKFVPHPHIGSKWCIYPTYVQS
jgi:hypothetical protein